MTKNSMATASVVLGILSVFSCSLIVAAVPLGALAVLCALLSKTEKKWTKKSMVGLIAGILAAVSSCVITVQSFRSIMEDPQLRAYYSEYTRMLLDVYGLPAEYNLFDDGTQHADPNAGPDLQEPLPKEHIPDKRLPDDRSQNREDEMDSLYNEFFRFFYGTDPELEPLPQQPKDNAGGTFI